MFLLLLFLFVCFGGYKNTFVLIKKLSVCLRCIISSKNRKRKSNWIKKKIFSTVMSSYQENNWIFSIKQQPIGVGCTHISLWTILITMKSNVSQLKSENCLVFSFCSKKRKTIFFLFRKRSKVSCLKFTVERPKHPKKKPQLWVKHTN